MLWFFFVWFLNEAGSRRERTEREKETIKQEEYNLDQHQKRKRKGKRRRPRKNKRMEGHGSSGGSIDRYRTDSLNRGGGVARGWRQRAFGSSSSEQSRDRDRESVREDDESEVVMEIDHWM